MKLSILATVAAVAVVASAAPEIRDDPAAGAVYM